MSISAHARLLYIGLWTEAWDDGVFEWKPIRLKARIFPADNVDVLALLNELEAVDCIKQSEFEGRPVGLIRNFRLYQRPKKPNSSGMLSEQDAAYVGSVPNQYGTGGEIVSQMEDGGGRKEEEDTKQPPVILAERARDLFDDVWKAFPQNPTSNESAARRQFETMRSRDHAKLHEAALRYRRWFVEDCAARKRTEDAGLRYVPHLSTWIETGAWKEADALPIKSESEAQSVVPMTKLDRERDRELWVACERVMGKRVPTSGAEWWFRTEVVEQAREKAA